MEIFRKIWHRFLCTIAKLTLFLLVAYTITQFVNYIYLTDCSLVRNYIKHQSIYHCIGIK